MTTITKRITVIRIRNRSTIIDAQQIKNALYNEKNIINLKIERSMYGVKLGALSLTKKLGKKIHNSERNRKRKIRRKIANKK